MVAEERARAKLFGTAKNNVNFGAIFFHQNNRPTDRPTEIYNIKPHKKKQKKWTILAETLYQMILLI